MVDRQVFDLVIKRGTVIDAEGKIVAPRIVDLHTHYDSQIFWDSWRTMFGWHGVTILLHDLHINHLQNPGMYAINPVDQFHRNCWVAPFVEDDVFDLAEHMPVERILFSSDWPHAEGVGHPRDFLKNLTSFTAPQQQRIMMDNARELTFA